MVWSNALRNKVNRPLANHIDDTEPQKQTIYKSGDGFGPQLCGIRVNKPLANHTKIIQSLKHRSYRRVGMDLVQCHVEWGKKPMANHTDDKEPQTPTIYKDGDGFGPMPCGIGLTDPWQTIPMIQSLKHRPYI